MSGESGGLTRRNVLLGAASGIALAAMEAAQAKAQETQGVTVSGVVFEDRDGSGKAGGANPGLGGVIVSNGRDVAITSETLYAAAAGRGDDFRRQAGGLHAAGRSPDQSAPLLPSSSTQWLAARSQSDFRGA